MNERAKNRESEPYAAESRLFSLAVEVWMVATIGVFVGVRILDSKLFHVMYARLKGQ
jgi:hypothetical protein